MALAVHWREKGDHHEGSDGPDFQIATAASVSMAFPDAMIPAYGFDGRRNGNL